MSEPKRTAQARASSIDWAAIRRRMESAAAALERSATVTPERKAEVLGARARLLAHELQPEERPDRHLEVIEFVLAYERYALESAFVREVHPLKDLTALPGTPAFIAGIVNVRGQIVSVVDLKRFFDLPGKGITDLHKIVILSDAHADGARMEFGVLVDAVVGVHRLALREIQPPLPTLTGIRAEYLRGVTAQRLVILDAARLLADPKVIVRADAQS